VVLRLVIQGNATNQTRQLLFGPEKRLTTTIATTTTTTGTTTRAPGDRKKTGENHEFQCISDQVVRIWHKGMMVHHNG
jgi:hypothetical protein